MAPAQPPIGDISNTKIITAQPGPQSFLLSCPAQEIFFGGGRGSSKTTSILLDWIAHHAKYGEDARGVIFRRTTTEFVELVELGKQFLSPLGWEYRQQKSDWVHPQGGSLLYRYLEHDSDADKYQGWSRSFLAFDEVSAWNSPIPIDRLRAILRTSAKGVIPRMILTGNPGGAGQGWIKERYVDVAVPYTIITNKWGMTQCFIQATIRDNPALLENDPGYINRLRASGPSWLVRAWLEGDWDVVIDGTVFTRAMLKQGPLPREVQQRLAEGEKAFEVFEYVVHAWDTAIKTKQENDFSAVTVWGKWGEKYYLLDVWRGKMPFGEIKQMIKVFYEKHGAHRIVIEDKGSGESLLQELYRDPVVPPALLWPARPKGMDKIARAHTITPVFEAGQVILPMDEPESGAIYSIDCEKWLHPYMNELLAFQPGCAQDDMCFIAGTKVATLWGDKPVEKIKPGDLVITPVGLRSVSAAGLTGISAVVNKHGLTATPNHPVFSQQGFIPLDSIPYIVDNGLLNYKELMQWMYQKLLFSMARPTHSWGRGDIISISQNLLKDGKVLKDCMWRFGNFIVEKKFQKAFVFIIKMATVLTMTSLIWSVYRVSNMGRDTPGIARKLSESTWKKLGRWRLNGMQRLRAVVGIRSMRISLFVRKQLERLCVVCVGSLLNPRIFMPDIVPEPVVIKGGYEKTLRQFANGVPFVKKSSRHGIVPPKVNPPLFAAPNAEHGLLPNTGERQPVYNLCVADAGVYYANGILVSNCDSTVYALDFLIHKVLYNNSESKGPRLVSLYGR